MFWGSKKSGFANIAMLGEVNPKHVQQDRKGLQMSLQPSLLLSKGCSCEWGTQQEVAQDCVFEEKSIISSIGTTFKVMI